MKLGSLCTGYGGLDMAVGIEPSWVSDIDPGAIKLLEYRYPDIPNLGDLTTVDWSQVEPVDIITAGYPCQPFSAAGKRKGTADERHIWPYIANALRVLRPRYALFENVAGHVSLGLTDVLADLAEAGFDAEWTTLRASDVGAPHRRERLFILATNTRRRRRREDDRSRCSVERNADSGVQAGRDQDPSRTFGTPATPTNPEGNEQREPADTRAVRDESRNGAWAEYFPAITRWEHITGRTAPDPTTTNRTGRTVLNPGFVEWMMGLPAGWVTDVPGISRNGQLHLLGNGVVPQQARAALAELTSRATT